jgi:hypothetical protein
VIEDKSVSKHHMTLSVAEVKAGEGVRFLLRSTFATLTYRQSNIYARSELTLTEKSKLGTLLDGEKLSQTTRVLKGDKHTFQLGKYKPVFT